MDFMNQTALFISMVFNTIIIIMVSMQFLMDSKTHGETVHPNQMKAMRIFLYKIIFGILSFQNN